MKQFKPTIILILTSFLFSMCSKKDMTLGCEFEKINFETHAIEIPKEGELIQITSETPGWFFTDCQELINGEKNYIIHEDYHKETINGNWYTLYRKENVLTIVLQPNTDAEERTLLIGCRGHFLVSEQITVTQK